MKSIFRLSSLSVALLASAAISRAQTPYLETASLSFLAGFTVTGVGSTATSLTPVVPGAPGVIDPDKVRPIDRITTDIGAPIIYTLGNGDQAFFTKQLVRVVMEKAAEDYKSVYLERANAIKPISELIAATERAISVLTSTLQQTIDPDTRASLIAERDELEDQLEDQRNELLDLEAPYSERLSTLEGRVAYLKFHAEGKWELTAIRDAQTTVSGVASTPYSVFLTRIERTATGLSRSFDTGLRLEPIQSAGVATETLSNGRVVKAVGNYTTHFRLEFSSFYANDPLGAIKASERADAIDGEDYNTAGDLWTVGGTGYMTYSIRSTPGPLAAVVPSNIKTSGHGSWSHIIITKEGVSGTGGVAPFAIKMGEVKFQNRNLFPDFGSEL